MPQVDIVTYPPLMITFCIGFIIFFNAINNELALQYLNKYKLFLKSSLFYWKT